MTPKVALNPEVQLAVHGLTLRIQDLMLKKYEVSKFIGREKTTPSQREIFTQQYADHDEEIYGLQQQIARLKNPT